VAQAEQERDDTAWLVRLQHGLHDVEIRSEEKRDLARGGQEERDERRAFVCEGGEADMCVLENASKPLASSSLLHRHKKLNVRAPLHRHILALDLRGPDLEARRLRVLHRAVLHLVLAHLLVHHRRRHADGLVKEHNASLSRARGDQPTGTP